MIGLVVVDSFTVTLVNDLIFESELPTCLIVFNYSKFLEDFHLHVFRLVEIQSKSVLEIMEVLYIL